MTDNPFKAPAEPPMTFRDTCAVAAMQAIVTGVVTRGTKMSEAHYKEIVEAAYEMADDMVRERFKGGGAQ